MRLKQIKLAGFKSFVDPTSVPFPGQMSAIVGPNGCGKSNIIDAVRWVLGESSAKNLRGEAMTDVIFNGASGRKPVSQASIELIFDNSSGRISGEFANYNEISVKRTVTREPVAHYYLNGTKCRKRDIRDLFLGTGLGPRSYAIIEQGMISRLIESKPKDLRHFLEEAAGVSKYKERRRETELRIRHTRDNLERLEDVVAELNSQLERLKKQAAAAQRYKTLKAQERKLKGELSVLKWQTLDAESAQLKQVIQQKVTELESFKAQFQSNETSLVHCREDAFLVRRELDDNQHQIYLTGQEISKSEQQLDHFKSSYQAAEQERRQLKKELETLEQQLTIDKKTAENAQQILDELLPKSELVEAQWEQADEMLDNANDEKMRLDEAAQEISARYYRIESDVKIKRSQCDNIERILAEQVANSARSVQQLQQLNEQQGVDLEQITQEKDHAQAQLETLQQQVAQTQDQLQVDQQQLRDIEQQRRTYEQRLHQLEGELSSITTLLTFDLQNNSDQTKIATDNIIGPLFEQLTVADGWELAVSRVLADWNKALVVKQLPDDEQKILSGIWIAEQNLIDSSAAKASLAEKVSGPSAVIRLLSLVGIDKNQPLALGYIRPDGIWRGPDWLAGVSHEDPKNNRILLSKRKQQLADKVAEYQNKLADIQQSYQNTQAHLADLAKQLKDQQGHQQSYQNKLNELLQALNQAQLQTEYRAQKRAELSLQIEEVEIKQAQETERLNQTLTELDILNETLITVEAEKDSLQNQINQAQNQLASARARRDQLKSEEHELRLKIEQTRQQHKNSRDLIQHRQSSIASLQNKLAQAEAKIAASDDPSDDIKNHLEQMLSKQNFLQDSRTKLLNRENEIEQKMRSIEQVQQRIQGQIQDLQDKIAEFKIAEQGVRVQAESVLEVLTELNMRFATLLAEMPQEAEQKEWTLRLEKTQQNIKRLGAINLAAIEEYQQQAERSDYLNAQLDDLNEALATLEDAIRKIDRETKSRFQTTYDAVNQDLQALFPKVFGGGAAWLELTDDDLLEAGVAIMARPPGKRNSTIHLLSGGEKALTALALVFAIFRLNPAPFCMLDEVDAPLDDANVVRFCRLVEEMSESVQFIFISHNKIAMEMASHLIGVTMQEAGVSRMVSVDIDKAIELAELE
ncbi:chromosome segregation protein SMC [Gayadomonas joobiniege]|uniref:chromosome segregation protein SMC n=1 Tax=Gayadomonas joobiniege TaxID=1234606 RepID=UPI00035D2DBE|nr:chromosome segregation protein SMC [Gayadomonas joobiniege]